MAIQENHDGAIYWLGPAVENTAAYSARTLFVNGVRSIPQIIEYATDNECRHIHLGADDSFQKNKLWNNIVPELLNTGLKITLEYPVEAHDFLVETLNTDVWVHNNFIPVITFKIQNIEKLSKNLYLKVDDKSFDYSNDGIWTMPVAEITDRNRQTLWQDYSDVVLLRDADVKKPEIKKAPVKAEVAEKVAVENIAKDDANEPEKVEVETVAKTSTNTPAKKKRKKASKGATTAATDS